jgi:hypothetical protein
MDAQLHRLFMTLFLAACLVILNIFLTLNGFYDNLNFEEMPKLSFSFPLL